MNFNEYVGIPFKDNGRDRSGCDCWGLVRLALKEQFDKDAPSLAGYPDTEYASSENMVQTGLHEIEPQKVDNPKPGDIALIRLHGKLCHTGLYIGNNDILHTSKATGAIIENMDGIRQLRLKIEGFYRV